MFELSWLAGWKGEEALTAGCASLDVSMPSIKLHLLTACFLGLFRWSFLGTVFFHQSSFLHDSSFRGKKNSRVTSETKIRLSLSV